MSKLAFFGIIASFILLSAFAAPENEKVDLTKISQIPAGPYNFSLYSGYLFIDNSTDIARSFHYVFVTSMNNPVTDPVLLWLNGGPGCSSLDGFIYEHGPWLFEANSTAMKYNPYAWNANASVLYIESPVGVGFSNGTAIEYNDTFTAQDNVRAVIEFFKKFPELQPNDFYISGESYGGIYVPSLAQALHWSNQGSALKVNLKGIAVGNGVVSISDQERLIGLFNFLTRHNLVSYEKTMNFQNLCHLNYDPKICSDLVKQAYGYLRTISLNPYDVLNTCYNDTNQTLPSSFQRDYARFLDLYTIVEADLGDAINPFGGLPPCIDVLGGTIFFNNNTVKAAFHVSTDITWSICSQTLTYNKGDFANMSDTYNFLLEQGYKVIYYSGDSDWVCSTDLAEIFFRNLAKTFSLPVTVPKTPWHVPGNFPDEPQTAGFYQDYYNLRFMTFMGVGHMVPQWNKPGGQKMINWLLHGVELN